MLYLCLITIMLPIPLYAVACCGILAIVILLILALVFIGLSANFGSLSNKNSNNPIYISKNVTVLVSGEPINTLYQSTAMFDLSSTSTQFPDSLVCQFDCANNSPETFVVPLEFSYSYESNNNSSRLLARFAEGATVEQASIYLLGNSNFSFAMMLSADSPREPVFLHLFNDLVACDNFYADSDLESDLNLRHQIGVFNLNDFNGYSVSYVASEESYYCGVWVIQPNVSFNCTVVASVIVYNVSHYQSRNECMQSPSAQFAVPLLRPAPDPFSSTNICLLFSQVNIDTILSANVLLTGTFNNGQFSFTMSVLIFCVLCAISIPLIICLYVYCKGKTSQSTNV